MKHAKRRFENVVLRAVGPLVNGFETTICPDTYVGLVSDLRSASADFPTRQESTTRPAAPCVALILESPHDKEFKGAPGPAKGATGAQIRRHLAHLLQGEASSFGLLLVNAVQHQCSLGLPPRKYRDVVFSSAWAEFGRDDFMARLGATVRPGDFVVNACTRGTARGNSTELRRLVEAAIIESLGRPSDQKLPHPVSWWSLVGSRKSSWS